MSGTDGISLMPFGPPNGSRNRFQHSRMISPAANDPMRK